MTKKRRRFSVRGWVRFTKTFQGGRETRIIFYDDSTAAETVDDHLEEWADRHPAGHSCGYSSYWKKIKRPTNAEIMNMLAETRLSIKYQEDRLRRQRGVLRALETAIHGKK